MDIEAIQTQIDTTRRTVAFDSYDITVRQLYDMIISEMIDIAPEYQRHFKWKKERQSQLIESIYLGIPVPSLFMATNANSTWEVIDGLQRLTTIVNFIGTEEDIKNIDPKCERLKITGLEKLDTLNDLYFTDLPKSLQIMFMTRPIRVTVLNDRSDFKVRYDLFERLNTGGIILHPQEIRNCIYIGKFNDFIKECAENKDFQSVVKLPRDAERSGSLEEMALRFFAYYEYTDKFVHAVTGFLNDYMDDKTKKFNNRSKLNKIFSDTFSMLNRYLPGGIVRENRKNVTPVVLFEAVSVGVAKAIDEGKEVSRKKLTSLLDDPVLKKYTTGATNSKKVLHQRIDLVRNRVGK